MAAAAGLLGWTAVLGLHHPEAAVAALGALLLGLIRVVLTHRENLALAASRREAITDELTGLANRRHLLRRIDEALEPAAAGEPAPAALMLIDLDRFKELNDSLGHQAGDQLLTAFAGRLRRAVDHAGLAARLGGDEFAVLLPGARRTDALDVAARVHRALARTFAVAGGDAHIAASVGIALALDRGDTPAALLRRADLAMYEAKRGATGTHVSTPADGGGSGPAARLRRAIEAGEMEMHYQPQGELPSGGVVGVEALIRWRHPERGLLVPAEFLPALRDAGLMRRLTHTVIAQALEQAGRWAAGGLVVPIAVNVSAEDMLDPGFAVEVEELLACSGVPADRLRIEISENAPMADLDLVRATVRRLRAAGVEVALDDFGAGYSALAYLRQLEFDELKLDRSLVAGIAGDADGTAIVGAVVELAHTLGLRVVAEGVEDAESWRLLATLGCDVGQGFYLGRPVAPEELAPWLAGRPLLMVRPG
jgi:diguanylate cyclase (GGDEF)-like protein